MNEESCHNLVHLNSAFLNRLYESNDISVKKILDLAKNIEKIREILFTILLSSPDFPSI